MTRGQHYVLLVATILRWHSCDTAPLVLARFQNQLNNNTAH